VRCNETATNTLTPGEVYSGKVTNTIWEGHLRREALPILILAALTIVLVAQGYPLVSAQSRMLYGYVYNASTGSPIAATITVSRCFNQQSVTTNSNGAWQLSYAYGTLGTISFSAPGYATQTLELNLNAQWYYSGGVVSLVPA